MCHTIPLDLRSLLPLTLLACLIPSLVLAQTAEQTRCTPQTPPTSITNLYNTFPPVFTIASMSHANVRNDAVGQKLYRELLATKNPLLDVPPRGTHTNSLQGVRYDTNADPDCWWTATGCHTPKAADLQPDQFTCEIPRTWALSFDDGPACAHDALYDFLNQQKQKATMFFIGTNVVVNALEGQRALKDGHEICLHSWSHNMMTSLTNEEAFAELYYSKKAIKDIIGVTTQCWRPPYGDVNDRIRFIAQFLDLQTIIWDQDTDDWSRDNGVPKATIDKNYEKIISSANDQDGTMVLTHEVSPNTWLEFMQQYPAIKKAFNHIVPIGACLNDTHPYAEEDISYPDFQEYIAGHIQGDNLVPVVGNVSSLRFGNVVSGTTSALPSSSPAAGGAPNANTASAAKSTVTPGPGSASGSPSSTVNKSSGAERSFVGGVGAGIALAAAAAGAFARLF